MVHHVDIVFDSTKAANKEFPNFVLQEPIENVIGLSLMWANIPNSWYNIDQNNNTFYMRMQVFDWEDTPPAEDVARFPAEVWREFECIMRPGAYSSDTLKSELKRAINYASIELTYVWPAGGPSTVTRTVFPLNGGKFYFHIQPEDSRMMWYYEETTGRTTYVQINFPAGLAEIVGFQPDTYFPTNPASSKYGVWIGGEPKQTAAIQSTGTNPVKLLTAQTLNLHSTLSDFIKVKDVRPQRDIMEIIPVTANYGGFIFHQHSIDMQPTQYRTTIYGAEFYLTQGYLTEYQQPLTNAILREQWVVKNHVVLNGEGFQVAVRFYIDDGT